MERACRWVRVVRGGRPAWTGLALSLMVAAPAPAGAADNSVGVRLPADAAPPAQPQTPLISEVQQVKSLPTVGSGGDAAGRPHHRGFWLVILIAATGGAGSIWLTRRVEGT